VDNCHANATCTDTDGGFTCACDSGYTGDGTACAVIRCAENEFVSTNIYRPCAAGSTNAAGDDASGGDTKCIFHCVGLNGQAVQHLGFETRVVSRDVPVNYPPVVTTRLQPVIFVNASVVGGDGSGSNWENATQDLQAAIDAGNRRDIWVAKGVYHPTGVFNAGETLCETQVQTRQCLNGIFEQDWGTPDGDPLYSPGSACNRNVSFELASRVNIYGGFSGNENSVDARDFIGNKTILSGEIGDPDDPSDNSKTVVSVTNVSFSNLDGFTITGGYSKGSVFQNGAGMEMSIQSTLTLANIVFAGNTKEQDGGGLAVSIQSRPALTNVIFTGNKAGGDGGGLYLEIQSRVSMTNVVFLWNVAGARGGAIGSGTDATISGINVTFSGNVANEGGS
jgi:hypothetical protein